MKVDDRECLEHPEIPIALAIPGMIIERLDSGDYAFLDRDNAPVGIERCEIGNFVAKVGSGELETQLYRCQEAYNTVILLIEGIYAPFGGLLALYKPGNRGYYRSHVYPRLTYKYIKAVEIKLGEFGIEIVHSPDFETSLETIKTIHDQRTKPTEYSTLFKHTRSVLLPTKLTANPAVPRLIALCPRMPEKVAIRLINRFGSIWGILMAPEEEVLGDGFGKASLQKLRGNIGIG